MARQNQNQNIQNIKQQYLRNNRQPMNNRNEQNQKNPQNRQKQEFQNRREENDQQF